VYEKAPDVGGVWSRTRRYPGLSTQNDKRTYSLSDFPMPRDYPEWPTGEQVQAYLQAYAERFGLVDKIRLCTEVMAANPSPRGGWAMRTSAGADTADHGAGRRSGRLHRQHRRQGRRPAQRRHWPGGRSYLEQVGCSKRLGALLEWLPMPPGPVRGRFVPQVPISSRRQARIEC
jgi:hypothetical protein